MIRATVNAIVGKAAAARRIAFIQLVAATTSATITTLLRRLLGLLRLLGPLLFLLSRRFGRLLVLLLLSIFLGLQALPDCFHHHHLL